MGGMADLMTFLAARLNEDEAVATACADYDGNLAWFDSPVMASIADHTIRTVDGNRPVCRVRGSDSEADDGERTLDPHAQAAHIARNNPARALREVAVKRAIIAMWQKPEGDRYLPTGEVVAQVAVSEAIRKVVCELAETYDAHPDYDPRWSA